MNELTGYELSKDWFDYAYENPELIRPTHTAMYFFIIDHNNRLGWKDKFGFPMEMAKDAIGIKNYRTYKNTFEDLITWGFIKIYQRSKNQYSANVIGLVKNTKATTKALSKAIQKHSQKQYKSIVGVVKPINHITIKPINKGVVFPFDSEDFLKTWDIWKKYKKVEHNFKYKSEISEQAALKKLNNLADNEQQAIQIIYQSIENGWKGFFKLKNDGRDSNQWAKLHEQYQ